MTAATSRLPPKSVSIGFALGVLVALPAILAAVASGGAGHGDYVATRWLFPVPSLLTLLEHDRFGVFALGVGLLQFPVYGAVVGWSVSRKNYVPAMLLMAAHILAAALCFSGILPNL